MTKKTILPVIALVLLGLMAAVAIWPFYNEFRTMLHDARRYMSRGMNQEAWNELQAARTRKSGNPDVEALSDILLLCGLDARFYHGVKFRGLPFRNERLRILDLDSSRDNPEKPSLKSPFSIRLTGKLRIPVSGKWSLGADVDDGIRLILAEQVLLDCLGHNGATRCLADVNLKAGFHEIQIDYAIGVAEPV